MLGVNLRLQVTLQERKTAIFAFSVGEEKLAHWVLKNVNLKCWARNIRHSLCTTSFSKTAIEEPFHRRGYLWRFLSPIRACTAKIFKYVKTSSLFPFSSSVGVEKKRSHLHFWVVCVMAAETFWPFLYISAFGQLAWKREQLFQVPNWFVWPNNKTEKKSPRKYRLPSWELLNVRE